MTILVDPERVLTPAVHAHGRVSMSVSDPHQRIPVSRSQSRQSFPMARSQIGHGFPVTVEDGLVMGHHVMMETVGVGVADPTRRTYSRRLQVGQRSHLLMGKYQSYQLLRSL